jgi:hypothetical protein
VLRWLLHGDSLSDSKDLLIPFISTYLPSMPSLAEDRVTKGPEGVKESVRAQMNSMNVDDLQCFRRRSSAFIGGTPTGLAL